MRRLTQFEVLSVGVALTLCLNLALLPPHSLLRENIPHLPRRASHLICGDQEELDLTVVVVDLRILFRHLQFRDHGSSSREDWLGCGDQLDKADEIFVVAGRSGG